MQKKWQDMLFGWKVNKWRVDTSAHKKRGFSWWRVYWTSNINVTDRRLIILNIGTDCFPRSFAGSKTKAVIKTVHYHAKITLNFPLMVWNYSTRIGSVWTNGQCLLQKLSIVAYHCIFCNNNNIIIIIIIITQTNVRQFDTAQSSPWSVYSYVESSNTQHMPYISKFLAE